MISRGLDFTVFSGFNRRYIDSKVFDNYKYKYTDHYRFALGKLRMDEALIKLMGQTVLEFRPDDLFFFFPRQQHDIYQIFQTYRPLIGS